MTNENGQRPITITLTERQWRSLRFEAKLLSQVFAQSITPVDVAQVRLDRSLSRVTARSR